MLLLLFLATFTRHKNKYNKGRRWRSTRDFPSQEDGNSVEDLVYITRFPRGSRGLSVYLCVCVCVYQ